MSYSNIHRLMKDALKAGLRFDLASTDVMSVLPNVDDTGYVAIGNGTYDMDVKWFGGATTDYVLYDVGNKSLTVAGDMLINLSNMTIASGNATAGGVIKAGTAAAPVTEDTASTKFVSLYWDCGATSGDSRGIYNRLYITGAGGGGESLRTFTTVSDVAGATAHGYHASLSFATSGSITGLGVAGRNTLQLPDGAVTSGTLSALQAELWADGSSTNPAANPYPLSLLRMTIGGDGTGAAAVEDDCYAIDFATGTPASGNVFSDWGNEPSWTGKTAAIRCRAPDGTACYLVAWKA